MSDRVPRPDDPADLERLVKKFAQDWLKDPLAHRVGRSGENQFGADVRAVGPDGALWAFQAKCTQRFQRNHLDKEIERLKAWNWRPSYYIVVTTAPASTPTQDRAVYWRRELGIRIAVWDWEHFEELLLEHVGVGPWLKASERRERQKCHVDSQQKVWQKAREFHPLSLNDARLLEHVWAPPTFQEEVTENVMVLKSRVRMPRTYSRTLELKAFASTLRSASNRLVVLEAPAGSGKTVTLLKMAAFLASAPEGPPLPVLVGASRLLEQRMDSVMDAEGLGLLWRDPMTRWILLVDGLDEVPERRFKEIERLLGRLVDDARIAGVLATCRSSHLSLHAFAGARRVSISPWSKADLERIGGTRMPEWATTPEEAAGYHICTPDPDIPLSRIQARDLLFERIVGKRGATVDGRERALEALSWELISEGGTAAQVSLDARVPELSAALNLAVKELEILARDDKGTVTITRRGVVEALASKELARLGLERIWAAATKRSTAETARMALVRAARVDSSILDRFFARFREKDWPNLAVILGPVLDLKTEDARIVRQVVQLLIDLVLEETSQFNRDVGGRWVSAFALQGGPVWEALRERLEPLLFVPPDRAAFLAWQTETREPSLYDLYEMLAEEDVEVRSLAARLLERWKDHPGGREWLLLAILDPGFDPLTSALPCVEAGRVLRDATRDEDFDGLRESLVATLRERSQFASGGAAIALLPGEAPAAELLDALRFLSSAAHIPAVEFAIQELASTPEGATWLSSNWPNRRTPPSQGWEPPPSSPPTKSRPHPSRRVQEELGRCLAFGYLHDGEWTRLPRSIRWDIRVLEGLATLDVDQLAVVFRDILEAPRFLPLWSRAQDALGRIVVSDTLLRRTLLAKWETVRNQVASSYPGLALEPLVVAGDEEAIRVYAEWLRFSPFIGIFAEYRPFLPAALEQETVRSAAVAVAQEAWLRATQRDDKGGYLWCGALGAMLGGLWPAWEKDAQIREGLLRRAVSEEQSQPFDWFGAALTAWAQGDNPQELRDTLAGHLRNWEVLQDRSPFFHTSELLLWIDAADKAGLGAALLSVWRDIVERGIRPVCYPAAVMLAKYDPMAARDASLRMAGIWPSASAHITARNVLAPLVALAPEAWLNRVSVVAPHTYAHGQEILDLCGILLELGLPEPLWHKVHEILDAVANLEPALWLRRRRGFDTFRLTDEARRLQITSEAAVFPE